MTYQVEVPEPIAKELRALPQETRRAIGFGYAIHRQRSPGRPR